MLGTHFYIGYGVKMGNTWKNGAEPTGRLFKPIKSFLLVIFSISVLTTLATAWFQYQQVYRTDAFIAQSFGETYTPPGFYAYYIPLVVVFSLISFIPLVLYFIRRTEKLWLYTAFGTIMSISGFVAGVIFHLGMAVLMLCYVVYGVILIMIGDEIEKERNSEHSPLFVPESR